MRSGAKFRHSRSSAVIISQRRRPAPSCPICLNHRLRACSLMESGHKIGQNTILGECLRIKTVKITSFMLVIREDIPKKCCCSFGFCSNEGGERALPNSFVTFSKVHFWSKKGVYFLQNANNLNFQLFLGCIHDHQIRETVKNVLADFVR